MSANNKDIVRRSYEEIWGKGNLGVIDELYADNYVNHGSPPGVPPDREGLKMFIGMYTGAFPNTQMTIEDMVAEGDRVVARWSAQGKHEGELMGIPATGKDVHVTGIDIYRLAGGKIVESWDIFDQMGLMQQLGVIPSE